MTSTPTEGSPQLLPCPFCGTCPGFGLSKKTHCQLHGEPFQAVTLRCVNPKCPVKPGVAAGDVFNGGEAKARDEAANIWNARAAPAGEPSGDALRPIAEAKQDGRNYVLYDEREDVYVIGYWGKHNHVPMYGWVWQQELYGEEVDGFDPTHFSELPALSRTPTSESVKR